MPGTGTNTPNLNWTTFDTPGVVEAAITGILATDPTEGDEDEMTVEELTGAKPMFLYYFRQGLDDPMDDEYKFSRRFEMGLQTKLVKEINANWLCMKEGIDLEEELEKNEEKTRIEFWSAIETKMKVISISKKDQKMLAAGPMVRLLKKYSKVSKGLANKEIKRLEKIEKNLKKESAAK